MPFSRISALAGALSLASTVTAHGTVTGLVADGVYYQGYSPNFKYMQNPPKVAGWTTTSTDNGFVAPSQYTTSDVVCHLGATPGAASATVSAGGSINLQWTAWPESHHGPVINYLANCNGDCTTVDKAALEFFKIDGRGLVDGSSPPGKWASDDLITNNNTWTVTVPSDITPGNYILRHEIIALHSAGNADGAQNYPQCFNLEVTGSGTATPAGIPATEFYTPTDPGILVNIYTSLSSYEVPGPVLYSGTEGSTPTPTLAAGSSSTATTLAPAVTSMANLSSTTSLAVTSTPSIPSTIVPPYANGTSPSTKGSTCKSKPKKPTGVATGLPATKLNTITASVASVTIPTASPTAPSGGESTSTPSPVDPGEPVISLPEGTKLSSVLKWISNFYAKYGDGEYSGSSAVKRRHARHLNF